MHSLLIILSWLERLNNLYLIQREPQFISDPKTPIRALLHLYIYWDKTVTRNSIIIFNHHYLSLQLHAKGGEKDTPQPRLWTQHTRVSLYPNVVDSVRVLPRFPYALRKYFQFLGRYPVTCLKTQVCLTIKTNHLLPIVFTTVSHD